MANDVLVYIEFKDGKPTKAGLQALGAGANLAKSLGGSAIALVAGNGLDAEAATLGAYGAAKTLLASGDAFAQYSPDAVAKLISNQAQATSAVAVLASATSAGKDFLPRAAAISKAGLASDIVDLRAEGGKPVAVRPVYAGKARVSVQASGTLFASLRPNVFPTPAQGGGNTPVTPVTVAFGLADLRALVSEIVAGAAGKLDVAEAEIVCSGGRGMKDPATDGKQNWANLEKLAQTVGAAVGASRAVVDAGWRPHAEQVGQTGKTVSPKLYIACGISGAIQHLAGMSGSKVIVAINKDPQAPIFKIADYGIVGDVAEVIPALTDAFAHALR
ncbi:MAG: electron transfer flavoprotein subunit alpha/FixB family protein [Planctomycetes bacterium]|nr:electron transfer flavoprotein subunit alpha/FixB family protein [Planctomycetota bacterium]